MQSSACHWGEGKVWCGQQSAQGSQPEPPARPCLHSHGYVAVFCGFVEKEEERRQYCWHTWVEGAMSHLGYASISYMDARKHPVSNRERQREIL